MKAQRTMLLKELIDIPTHVGGQDFVLRLVEGVGQEQAKKTLEQYVITDEIARRFDEALGLIQNALGVTIANGAVQEGQAVAGRAAYLHGSFGSGKSHFMAILHLLLSGNEEALQRPELASVVSKHLPWMKGRRFLLVACHMLGAHSLEERVFDGYRRSIEREKPGAALPMLFNSDRLLQDAENLRQRLGDEAFFKLLEDDSAEAGWGDLAQGWTPATYEAAARAPQGDYQREQLVVALVERVFPSTGTDSHGAVAFDQGLERMSAHAKDLGYNGVVLFLDELILWLATKADDAAFIGWADRQVGQPGRSAETCRGRSPSYLSLLDSVT